MLWNVQHVGRRRIVEYEGVWIEEVEDGDDVVMVLCSPDLERFEIGWGYMPWFERGRVDIPVVTNAASFDTEHLLCFPVAESPKGALERYNSSGGESTDDIPPHLWDIDLRDPNKSTGIEHKYWAVVVDSKSIFDDDDPFDELAIHISLTDRSGAEVFRAEVHDVVVSKHSLQVSVKLLRRGVERVLDLTPSKTPWAETVLRGNRSHTKDLFDVRPQLHHLDAKSTGIPQADWLQLCAS